MPDRSLTCSRAGVPPCPPNPPGFIDLTKSSYCRRGIEATGNLDRTRRQMAAHDVGEWPVEDLPETITLGPGELRIVFDGALDLAARMLELSQAMMNNWMTVKRCLEEGPPPSSVRQARPRSRPFIVRRAESFAAGAAPGLPPSRPGEPPATTRVLLLVQGS